MACIAVTSIHDRTAARSADGTAQTGGTPTTVADAIAVVGRRTDVANQVGGQYAKVSAIMSNPDTDPGRPRISTRSRAPHRQFGQARVADHNGGSARAACRVPLPSLVEAAGMSPTPTAGCPQ